MLLSYNWLKEYIDIDMPAAELAEKLNMAGLPVEEIIEHKPPFTDVYSAEVLSVEKHPNADKLSLCSVYDGSETRKVVCGAPNVKKGHIVPLAKEGAVLSGGFKIKKTKIRGVESRGMICSEKELGLGDDQGGIMVLAPGSYKPGDVFSPVKPDTVFNLEITPNRADLLCVAGLARLISACLGKKVSYPDASIPKKYINPSQDIKKSLSIKIEDKKNCPRYSARLIQGVNTGESPGWLKEKLLSMNVRPINNIADITNYILLEMNHPLHAFDYSKIKGKKIIVRPAKNGEKITALNSETYTLNDKNLVIADSDDPIAIAGVMGGEYYSVDNNTTSVVLESAYFNPSSIRKTSRGLGISSDSSYRFERGINIDGTIKALDRAAELIVKTCGGTVSKNTIDIYPSPRRPALIPLRFARANDILGTSLSKTEIKKTIKKTGFKIKKELKDNINVEVPLYRPDISGEIDLIEDIAQVSSYENIPVTMPESALTIGKEPGIDNFIRKIKRSMMKYGFSEAVNYSFLNNKLLKNLGAGGFSPKEPAVIKNPFNEEETRMKTTLIPDLLKNLITNYNNENENIHLFEASRVFHKKGPGEYIQEEWLGGVTYGNIINPAFTGKNFKTDFNYMKSAIGAVYGIVNAGGRFAYELSPEKNPFFEYAADIEAAGVKIGRAGQVSEDILHNNRFRDKAFIFELNLDKLYSLYGGPVTYSPVSPYPIVKRDLSLLVNSDIPEAKVEKLIRSGYEKLIKGLNLYDLYRGGQVPAGKKSLTYSIIFQSDKKTLSEKEINKTMESIVRRLKNEINAELRS